MGWGTRSPVPGVGIREGLLAWAPQRAFLKGKQAGSRGPGHWERAGVGTSRWVQGCWAARHYLGAGWGPWRPHAPWTCRGA